MLSRSSKCVESGELQNALTTAFAHRTYSYVLTCVLLRQNRRALCARFPCRRSASGAVLLARHGRIDPRASAETLILAPV